MTIIVVSAVLVFRQERSLGQGVKEASDRIQRMPDPSLGG